MGNSRNVCLVWVVVSESGWMQMTSTQAWKTHRSSSRLGEHAMDLEVSTYLSKNVSMPENTVIPS
jgi:hypothetical protein